MMRGAIFGGNQLVMIQFKKASELRKYLDEQQKKGNSIGFVPTMGALHEGHISLLSKAKAQNELAVVSIFVNPTQFNDPEDFKKYPITTETDIQQLLDGNCDILFLPSVDEIYPNGPETGRYYDLGLLERRLEGEFRPGHFQGVCMVVHRLLDIVRPERLYLGQKDFQQCMVIRRLINLIGMSHTDLVIAPTLREPDGLAMSSRNRRLLPAERAIAPTIYQVLSFLKNNLKAGPLDTLRQQSVSMLVDKKFRVDYIDIVRPASLEPVHVWDGKEPLVALAAAFLGRVRLIDNLLLTATSASE